MKEKIAELKRLVARASNPRQRGMYEKLLELALSQSEEEKRASTAVKITEEFKTTTSSKKLPLGEEKVKSSKEATKSSTTELKEKNLALSESNRQEASKEENHYQVKKTQKETKTAKESSNTAPSIFQAIGVMEGTITTEENGKLSITIEGKKYALGYVTQSKKKHYQELVAELAEKKNLQGKIAVYPHYNHQGERGSLRFNLVSVEKKEKKGTIFSELEAGEFRIAGFWQYIPDCEAPCITIMRNYQPSLANIVKQRGQKKAKGLLKANHLPIFWSNAPIEAFKYNRELSKKEQMPRYFVQLKVKWKGESGLFEVIEEVGEASTIAPKYLKYKG